MELAGRTHFSLPMFSLAHSPASSLAPVSLRLAPFSCSALTLCKNGCPSDQVAFYVAFPSGLGLVLRWSLGLEEQSRRLLCVRTTMCLCMHVCTTCIWGLECSEEQVDEVVFICTGNIQGREPPPRPRPLLYFSFLSLMFMNKSSTESLGNTDLSHGLLFPIFVTFKMEHRSPLGA